VFQRNVIHTVIIAHRREAGPNLHIANVCAVCFLAGQGIDASKGYENAVVYLGRSGFYIKSYSFAP